ncbi:MAG TPA: type VI secretion system contractile sheath large subunit [Planctomycetota bacterium]|nr:type VI secretion system contractile sheath large subunit [Planctomycetota bacterium]
MDDDKRVKGFRSDFGFGPTNHPEVRPLPFRLMVVGDFCGAVHDRTRGAVRIDAHDFDAVMASLGARARFEVDNLIGASAGAGEPGMTIQVDIAVTSLESFEPSRVVAGIPALATLREFVRCARALAAGSIAPAAFERDLAQFRALPVLREPLQAVLDRLDASKRNPTRGDEPPLDAHLESIFAMVDVPKPSGDGSHDRAADATGQGSAPGIDVSRGIALAEAALARQLRAVTEHGAFRRLERSWRGLRFLCRKGKGAQIELFDGDFDAWHERVYEAEYTGTSPAPLSLVVLSDAIGNSAMGMDTLQRWGEAGEQIQCGVVFDAGELPGEPMQALARRDAPSQLFEDARFDKWRSLRDKDASRWLCAALNGWVLPRAHSRPPSDADTPPLFGSPVWLVAATVAQSMQRTGWPSAHTGAHDGEIEQLPIHTHADGAAHPLETVLSDHALRDLSRAGFTPLTCKPNHDSAWVLLAPTVHRPGKNEQHARRGTLAHQLLAARIGEMIVRNKAALVVPGDMQGSAANFTRFLSGLLADTGPGAAVDVQPQGTTLVLAMRTGSRVLGGTELQLGVDVE